MTNQTAGELDELATSNGSIDGIAPPVRIEPCAEFRLDHASAWPVCGACGWLEDDHAPDIPECAVVMELAPRRRAPTPERMAS